MQTRFRFTPIFLPAVILLFSSQLFAQPEIFVLHNIIRGDSVYNTYDKQVAFIKQTGFDGIEINENENFDQMKAAIDRNGFKGSYYYVKLPLLEGEINEDLKKRIRQLKGSGTIISPYIPYMKEHPVRTAAIDSLLAARLRQLSELAAASDLKIAIYPHTGDYVARTSHAFEIANATGRKNVGIAFNLCHWLANTTKEERSSLKQQLRTFSPKIYMVTINGANDVMTDKKFIWDDYILPLGQGNFNTYEVVRFLIKDLKLTAPIGVQCYGIKADKPALVRSTMEVWKEYLRKMK